MRPQLWVIAGGNGCGKSTIVDKHLAGRLTIVNADNILRNNPHLGLIGAGRHTIELQKSLLQQGQHFAWETTLSGQRELKFMQEAKAAGYKVNLIYVSLQDPSDSIQRVANRVRAGGHNVPKEDVIRRFQRSLENLPEALQIADRAFVFDNSEQRRRLLLSRETGQTRRVASNLPSWLTNAVSADILSRGKGLER